VLLWRHYWPLAPSGTRPDTVLFRLLFCSRGVDFAVASRRASFLPRRCLNLFPRFRYRPFPNPSNAIFHWLTVLNVPDFYFYQTLCRPFVDRGSFGKPNFLDLPLIDIHHNASLYELCLSLHVLAIHSIAFLELVDRATPSLTPSYKFFFSWTAL